MWDLEENDRTYVYSEGRTSARRLMKYCEERRYAEFKGLGWRDKCVGRTA